MDVKHMPPGVEGFRYILVTVCAITRYMVAIPLKRADAKSIAEGILKIKFQFGLPSLLVSDLGAENCNQLTAYLCDALGIKHTAVSPFNHQALRAERAIQTLSNYLKSNLTERGRDWPIYIAPTVYAYNTQTHMTTKESPYYLLFARYPNTLPSINYQPISDIKTSYREYAQYLRDRLECIGQEIIKLETKNQL